MMVRTYKKKTDRCDIDEGEMKDAVKAVLSRRMSQRAACVTFGVKRSTLQHRIHKTLRERNLNVEHLDDSGQDSGSSDDGELPKKSKYASRQHGLTYKNIRMLAYDFARASNCNHPDSWDNLHMAGTDWMKSFMRRHTTLSLRKPENTSIARIAGFNKESVEEFYSNLEQVLRKYKFSPRRIFNLDETGVTTVLPSPKVVAEKEGAPYGTLGLASKSGWMTASLFVEVLHHIKKNINCSTEDPILLIIDNHETHASLAAINFCRDNGITMVSFPPHTSHRLQPLDVSVFGPFKTYCNVSFNDWMINPENNNRKISILNIAKLISTPFYKAFTPENIVKGFKITGIHPFNKLAFSEAEFVAVEKDEDGPTQQDVSESMPSTSQAPSASALLNRNSLTPESIRKSRIYTSTPEKARIEELVRAREEKLKKNPKVLMNLNKSQIVKSSKNSVKRKIVESSSSAESSDEIDYGDSDLDVSEEITQELCDSDMLNVNDFILVRFKTKSSIVHYVGRIEKMFETDDVATVDRQDVVLKLPRPSVTGGTERAASHITFQVDFSAYNVK
ncbi:hypothetical protein NQ314_018788 [Rhamnusium bicolor]|uniref:DDE-1 domain-containing protein n=1 Tax=Rhamnusium bicolor TaxID=1586634 RepID=A0AAV8WQ29_9CUCU|nr:hypothetical protein NQ314_018788 [Rhamnusium bicolor]